MSCSKSSSDIGKSPKSSSKEGDSPDSGIKKYIKFLGKCWIFLISARLFRGTLSIVLRFSGIKNVHVGLLEVFAFGKIDLVGTADLF